MSSQISNSPSLKRARHQAFLILKLKRAYGALLARCGGTVTVPCVGLRSNLTIWEKGMFLCEFGLQHRSCALLCARRLKLRYEISMSLRGMECPRIGRFVTPKARRLERSTTHSSVWGFTFLVGLHRLSLRH